MRTDGVSIERKLTNIRRYMVMNKHVIAGIALLLGGVLSSAAYADVAVKSCSIVFANMVNTESAKKFLKDTQGIRDDLIVKQLMLRQESGKDVRDENRTEALQWDIADLQHELEVAAGKNGIPIDGMWCATNCGFSGSEKRQQQS